MVGSGRRVILVAGPSGAGKSHLASRLGLPILQLDDYYKNGDDPSLPRFASGAVDWDNRAAWNLDAAMTGVRELCASGSTDVPIYDISANSCVGHRVLHLGAETCFVAEGIFAAELVTACTSERLLGSAICVRRSRAVTFVLRLARDLHEHRKPPAVLLKRGWWLARREPEIVAALVAQGCTPMTPREAEDHIGRLRARWSP
jgi:uridine kinase